MCANRTSRAKFPKQHIDSATRECSHYVLAASTALGPRNKVAWTTLALVVLWFPVTGEAMQVDLLRLVLVERTQVDAFERPGGRDMSREQFLRAVFAERIEFGHKGHEFHFVPAEDAVHAFEGVRETAYIVGRIGRPHVVIENEPPEEGLSEIDREAWVASAVIVDPTHHADGQKVAFEHKRTVGRPLAIFRSLAQHLNERSPKEPYFIEANAIVDPETFWQFEEENRGDIVAIEFDLIAPNMFGTRDEFDAELRALRDHERAEKAKLALENPDGLKLDTERVHNAVGYALEGGGGVKARTKRRKKFDSNRRGRRITIEEPPAADQSFLARVGRAIVRAFTP
jgi:hypothetical protein